MAVYVTDWSGTWTTSTGVEHYVMRGVCVTCGRRHSTAHMPSVVKHLTTDCEVSVKRGNYPYECTHADRHPDDYVITCQSHGAWTPVAELVEYA